MATKAKWYQMVAEKMRVRATSNSRPEKAMKKTPRAMAMGVHDKAWIRLGQIWVRPSDQRSAFSKGKQPGAPRRAGRLRPPHLRAPAVCFRSFVGC
jgi:hypothetical protein